MKEFEYGIIGGGPAGYSAGMYLAKQGHSVVLFEKNLMGGTCLNRGCIPTKYFLHSSQVYADIQKSADYGISAENITLDFKKVVENKNLTVGKIRKSLELAVKNSGVQTVYAEACIKDNNTIVAEGEEYKVSKIIVATGSEPRKIKGMEFDGKFVLSSDDILSIETLPKSIVIVGSGAIGIEWARILSNYGVEVTVVEMAEHLLPIADIEVSKRIERIFKQKKIKFYLNSGVAKIENKTVELTSGEVLTPEVVLLATGRVPVCLACNAEILGDACGEIQLAHYAIHQAKALALNIPFDKTKVPSIIYGEPEIAWVGLREQDCDETYVKHTLPITALGKSWCDGATEGFIKIIAKENRIVGAHIVSKEASSLIHILLEAIQNNLTIEDLKQICFAHPTYAEGIYDLLLQF